MRFCERYPEFCRKYAEEHNISLEDVEKASDHYFDSIVDCIANPTMPTIYLDNFGWFRPSKGTLMRRIESLFRARRLGTIDDDEVRRKLSIYWPVYRRLIAEDYKKIKKGIDHRPDDNYTRWMEKFKENRR